MRFRERVLETDTIVSFDKTDSECRRNEVFDSSFFLLHYVCSVDDLGDVFSYRGVRTW